MSFKNPDPRATAAAVVLAALVAAGCGGDDSRQSVPATHQSITVAAASDLRLAFEDVAEVFTQATGVEVTFSFGSSGQLREQIINGAPFDLFASANAAFIDEVIEAGKGTESTRADYAYGRIAVAASAGKPLPASLAELADARYARVAIANPEHAPYGEAAEQALTAESVIEAVRPKLVLSENISDALRIVQSGNADVGLVALSLVITGDDDYLLIDESLHKPLRQALVVTGEGGRGKAARRFAEFLASAGGREIMVRYGFVLPGDELAR